MQIQKKPDNLEELKFWFWKQFFYLSKKRYCPPHV